MYLLSILLTYLIYNKVEVVSTDQDDDKQISSKYKHEKYIELFVVVDHLAYSYHGDDTENYVLEILKMVVSIWDSPSLGVDVGFFLTGLEILDHPHPLLRDSDDANSILMDFRHWLSRESSQYLDFKFDVAILITRKNIHMDSNYDATGKGFVGGICIDDMKMAVVEDDRPMGLAVSTAHELGHMLGMYHDYQYNNILCPDRTFVMSGFAVGGPMSVKWSSCSKEAVQKFIDRGRSTSCLNVHGEGEVITGDRTAGTRYPADFQCSMLRRQKSSACVKEDMCSELLCASSNPTKPCVTNHRPPLDGTRCGENKWCQQGLCVDKPNKIKPQQANQYLNIRRFGAAAPSKNTAHIFLDISWKIMLLFVFILLFKQSMNLLRLCSGHILYRIRNRHRPSRIQIL